MWWLRCIRTIPYARFHTHNPHSVSAERTERARFQCFLYLARSVHCCCRHCFCIAPLRYRHTHTRRHCELALPVCISQSPQCAGPLKWKQQMWKTEKTIRFDSIELRFWRKCSFVHGRETATTLPAPTYTVYTAVSNVSQITYGNAPVCVYVSAVYVTHILWLFKMLFACWCTSTSKYRNTTEQNVISSLVKYFVCRMCVSFSSLAHATTQSTLVNSIFLLFLLFLFSKCWEYSAADETFVNRLIFCWCKKWRRRPIFQQFVDYF